MNDTNKERAAFEAHWYDLYHCGSISPDADGRYINPSVQRAWEAWQARAAKAPAAEPFAYCQPDDPLSSTAFVWPGIKRDPRHTMPLYTAPPAPTEQWRDIETAPQDGTRVILAEAEKVFHGGFVGVQFKEHRDADGNYIDQTDPDAYWLNFEDGDVCHPTHWQPEPALPAPPQGAAK